MGKLKYGSIKILDRIIYIKKDQSCIRQRYWVNKIGKNSIRIILEVKEKLFSRYLKLLIRSIIIIHHLQHINNKYYLNYQYISKRITDHQTVSLIYYIH